MLRFRKHSRTGALWMVLLPTAISGCQSGQKPCEDIAPGAIPQPNGTYACQWIHAETARADRDNFVIYQYEWSADGTRLTQFGQEHMARIAQGLPQVPFPVVIEPVSDPRLNEIRRMAVLESLANCHVPIVPERVVIGRSEAEGLYGDEAVGVAARMLRNTASGQGGGARWAAGRQTRWAGAQAGSMSGGASTSGGGGIGIY